MHKLLSSPILVPRAHDPSGLGQKSRALGVTISGIRHRCRLRESRLFPLLFQNGCSQSSRFRPLVKGNEDSGNEIVQVLKKSSHVMQLQLLDFSRETLLVNLSRIFTLNITGVCNFTSFRHRPKYFAQIYRAQYNKKINSPSIVA